jgi:hypothetical protein
MTVTLAYLDPSTGSLIASAVVGGAAAVGVAAKQARSRLTGALRRRRPAEARVEKTPGAAEPVDAVAAAEPRDATATEAGAEPAAGSA